MPQAVSIVEFNEKSNRAYTLNVKALEAILGSRGIANKKVAVISIAGAFRKGKSFLLNFFIAYIEWLMKGQKGEWLNAKTPLDKFHYKGGSQRDTNGILMWDTPYQFESLDGEQILVFFMDTQGTFDHQSSVHDCTTIFALSTLLSSVQIFNVSGQIQEDDLNNLRLFEEYAKLAGDQENQTQFQKLLFLIRDWPNSDEIDYGFEGGQDYLDDVMAITSKQKKELQNVRKNLKSSFESLEAFLMPHPGLTIARNNSQKVLGDQVEEEFLEQMKTFIPSFFSDEELVPKTINGKSLTCGELLELFKAYMEVFNSTELPEPQTILEATVKAVLVAAEQTAKKEYDDYIDQKMNEQHNLTSLSTLEKLHREAESRMLKKFSQRPKIGDGAAAGDIEEALRKYCQKKYEAHKKTVTENLCLEEEKKRLEVAKKKQMEEQEKERKRIKAEEERLRTEREAQERRRREQEETMRRQREEYERQRRADEERMRREEEERQRRQRDAEEQLRQERLEMERREQQRRAAEAERQREEQREREQERQRLQAQFEQQQRQLQQEQQRARRAEAAQLRAPRFDNYSSHSNSCSPSSYGGGSPSYPSGSSLREGVRLEHYISRAGNECTRYRGANGRFVSKANAYDD